MNAGGAPRARPILPASLRADTTEGYYLIPESGQRERLPSGFSMKMAEELLAAWLHEQAKAWQLPGQEAEVISKEFFRTIHGYYDSGEIISLRMQLSLVSCKLSLAGRWHFEIEAWLDIFSGF